MSFIRRDQAKLLTSISIVLALDGSRWEVDEVMARKRPA
jgi:hypothetical protein